MVLALVFNLDSGTAFSSDDRRNLLPEAARLLRFIFCRSPTARKSPLNKNQSPRLAIFLIVVALLAAAGLWTAAPHCQWP
jgi:hypothetical protein